MPFNGRSSYSTSFKGDPSITDHESDRLLNNARHGRLFKNPLGPIVPFMDKTTTGTNFKPNKINGPNIVRSKYVIQHNIHISSYIIYRIHQYITVYRKSISIKM